MKQDETGWTAAHPSASKVPSVGNGLVPAIGKKEASVVMVSLVCAAPASASVPDSTLMQASQDAQPLLSIHLGNFEGVYLLE